MSDRFYRLKHKNKDEYLFFVGYKCDLVSGGEIIKAVSYTTNPNLASFKIGGLNKIVGKVIDFGLGAELDNVEIETVDKVVTYMKPKSGGIKIASVRRRIEQKKVMAKLRFRPGS